MPDYPAGAHPLVIEVYERGVPEADRLADAELGWPWLRFMSLPGEELVKLADLIERIDYVPPADGGAPGDTSDLVDPATADPAWLAWRGQFSGLAFDRDTPTDVKRYAITNAATGLLAGSTAGLLAAVRDVLAEPRTLDHTKHFGGDPWVLELRTRHDEQPDHTVIREAIDGAAHAAMRILHAYSEPFIETAGWTEAFGVTSNVCPLPADNLYPSEDLLPC